jgi:transcriptional regulator with XRE-family HTH domain
MKTKDKLGEELREIRVKLKLSQKELAEKLKVSDVYLSYLEQGKKIPSREFLEDIYKLAGTEKVPTKIFSLLSHSKGELKKKKLSSFSSNNLIYLMQENSLFDQQSLRKLLEKEPQSLYLINGMVILLLRQKKQKEAEQFLLDSLKIIEKPEEKKWIQAIYNRMSGEYELAIQMMLRAIEEFDQNNKLPLSTEQKKMKAHFLFQTACLYFDYGQYLYNSKSDYQSSVVNFETALNYHNEISNLEVNPAYQMDYAGIYFWLALLGKSPYDNWVNYIREARKALKLNFYEGLRNFPSKNWNSVYSKPYIIATISFIGRSFAELSLLEEEQAKKEEFLDEGENYFMSCVPVMLDPRIVEYYRFYFNMACFYSIRAEYNLSLGKDYSTELDLCLKSLQEAERADQMNEFKLMYNELQANEGLIYFKAERKKELNLLLTTLKRRNKE